jgi:hypothetical protein
MRTGIEKSLGESLNRCVNLGPYLNAMITLSFLPQITRAAFFWSLHDEMGTAYRYGPPSWQEIFLFRYLAFSFTSLGITKLLSQIIQMIRGGILVGTIAVRSE